MSYIRFEKSGRSPSGKTGFWAVLESESGCELGSIKWYGPWRKYAFEPIGYPIFEEVCLREIATFCVNATLLHREAAANLRKATKEGATE